MNHLMSVHHAEYKVVCNSSSKPWERISAFMAECPPTLKELSTSAQMALEETQQHSQLSFVPDQQHLSQNSWCPTGKLSINQFSFGQASYLWSCPKKKQKVFIIFIWNRHKPIANSQISFLILSHKHLSLPVLPCEPLLAILVSGGSFSPSAKFLSQNTHHILQLLTLTVGKHRYFYSDTCKGT